MEHLLKGFCDELTKLAQSPSSGGGNPFRQVQQTAAARGNAQSRARTDANSNRIGAPTANALRAIKPQSMNYKPTTPKREYIPTPKQTFAPKAPEVVVPKKKRGKGGRGKGNLKDPGIAFERGRSSRELAEKRHNIKFRAEKERMAKLKAAEKPIRMSHMTRGSLGEGKNVGWSAADVARTKAEVAAAQAARAAKKITAPVSVPRSSPTTASK